MNMRTGVLAAALFFAASLATAMELDGRMVATLSIANDDGYSRWNAQLVTLGRLPRVDGPVPVIDPRYHPYDGEYHRRHRYGTSEEELGDALGRALVDAFDTMLHDNQPEPQPPHHGHRR